MSGKLRIVLGVLVLAAIGSVVYLLPSLSPSGQRAEIAAALTTDSARSDADHDGLVDKDETYWRTNPNNPDTDGDGFLDGEEILTGHNPLKVGPDDFLNPEQNATKRITGLVIGGLAAGDLDPKSPNYAASVKMLADAMATEYGRTVSTPKDTLTIIEDSDATKTEYVRAMSGAFLKLILPATTDTNTFFETFRDIPIASQSWVNEKPALYAAFTKESRRLAPLMESRALKLVAIPVPKSFEPQHTAAVRMLRLQQRYYELLGNYKEDPLLGSDALSGLLRLEYGGVKQLLYDFSQALSIKLQ